MRPPSLPPRILSALVGLAACCALGACASASAPLGTVGRVPPPGAEVLYPSPPDTTRIQFLAALSNEGDLQGRPPSAPNLVKPYGVAAANGAFYVCDTDARAVGIVDLQTRRLVRFTPSGLGALRTPSNCTVDPATGDLYVVDPEREDVVVFDSTLTYVDNIQVEGGRPGDVFVDGDTLWVSDLARHVVDVYHKRTRALVRTISGGDDNAPEKIRQPTSIWVTDRHLYVSDFGSFVVNVYERSGAYLRTVGSYGRGLGQFVRPRGIAVDHEDRLYVVDAAFENVQVFDAEGRLLLYFGGTYGGLGGLWLPASIDLAYDPADLKRFESHVRSGYELEYLLVVTNQYGPDRLSIYGFVRPSPESEPGH